MRAFFYITLQSLKVIYRDMDGGIKTAYKGNKGLQIKCLI